MTSLQPVETEGIHHLLAAGWITAYPTLRGPWTVAGPQGWGSLDPATQHVTATDPRTDSALPALSRAAQRGTVTNYRVGRRAVVATGSTFVKVVRPKRTADLVERHRLMESACSSLCGSHIRELNYEGSIEMWPAYGVSLHLELQRSSAAHLRPMMRMVARSLAELHSVDIPADTPEIEPRTPDQWLEIIERAEGYAPAEFITVASSLPPLQSSGTSCLVHGDLHDKNVFVTEDAAQFIDLDGIGRGTREDDVANLAVHLELRSLQGRLRADHGRFARQVLLDSYRQHAPLDHARLSVADAHTWFRLACIYRYRSGPANLSAQLLGRARAATRSADAQPIPSPVKTA